MSVPAPEALEATLNGSAARTGVKDALLKSTLRLQSDSKLVELLRDGFAPAFDVMVERYRLPLTRYCARMVGPDHADDVVQDTLTASYTALASDNRPIQLKPWLYRVAHNTAISALRKRGRQEHEQLDENFDGVRQPHEQLEQSQRLHDLVANMRALPERQRTALILQELEGMTPEEIADELDGSVPMVRQLVHRARERLRNGVGMLIPLPLILKLFGADKAAAATTKSAGTAAVTTKSAGVTVVGAAGGSSAKLAIVLAVGALAGGGVAVQQVIDTSSKRNQEKAFAGQTSAGSDVAAGPSENTGRTSRLARHAGGGAAAASPAAGSGPSAASEQPSGQSDLPRGDGDRENTGPGTAPEQSDDAPASNPDNGGSDSQPAPSGDTPSAGGGAGGGGQPSGDSGSGAPSSGGGSTETPPSGGGGTGSGETPPSGGGTQPSCKPVLGIPLPLVCLGQ